MDKYLPPADRQKGVALARQMETGAAAISSATQKPARVAGSAPSSAATPSPKAVAPASKVAATAPKAVTPNSKLATSAGRWRVQLGAYSSVQSAQEQWTAASKRIAALKGLQASYEAAGKLTRLRVGPLRDKAAAEQVCASVKAAGQGCFTVAP
jgi:cell division septation protein DedD